MWDRHNDLFVIKRIQQKWHDVTRDSFTEEWNFPLTGISHYTAFLAYTLIKQADIWKDPHGRELRAASSQEPGRN